MNRQRESTWISFVSSLMRNTSSNDRRRREKVNEKAGEKSFEKAAGWRVMSSRCSSSSSQRSLQTSGLSFSFMA